MGDGGFQYRNNQLGPAAMFGQMTGTLNDITLATARMKWERDLREQQLEMQRLGLGLQGQRLGIEQQRLAQQTAANASRAQYDTARAAAEDEKTRVSRGFGASVRRIAPMNQGPTREAGDILNRSDFMDYGAQSMAQAGKAGDLLVPKSLGQNDVAYDPLTGQIVARGNVSIAPGNTFQAPGGQSMIAPQYITLGPGQSSMYTGQPGVGTLAGMSPYPPNQAKGPAQGITPQIAATVLKSLEEQATYAPQGAPPNPNLGALQQYWGNEMSRALQAQTNAPSAVTTPGGQPVYTPQPGGYMAPMPKQPEPMPTLVPPPEQMQTNAPPTIRGSIYPQRGQGGEPVVPGLSYNLPKMDYRSPAGAAQLKHEALNAVLKEKRDPREVRRIYEEQTGLPADFLPY